MKKQRQEKQTNNFILDIISLDVKETSGNSFVSIHFKIYRKEWHPPATIAIISLGEKFMMKQKPIFER